MDTVSVLYCLLECDKNTNDMLLNLQEKAIEEYEGKDVYQAFVYGKKTVNARDYEPYKPDFYTMVDIATTNEEKEEYEYEKFEALLLAYTLLKKRIDELITNMQNEEVKLILITSKKRLPCKKKAFKKVYKFLLGEIEDWRENWEEEGLDITLDVYQFTRDDVQPVLYEMGDL